MDTLHDWKDNEYGYCLGLLRTNGDRNVPRRSIQSYFQVQISDAKRDARHDVAQALYAAFVAWERS